MSLDEYELNRKESNQLDRWLHEAEGKRRSGVELIDNYRRDNGDRIRVYSVRGAVVRLRPDAVPPQIWMNGTSSAKDRAKITIRRITGVSLQ